MNSISQCIAIASLIIVLALSKLIIAFFKLELKPVKYASIDGLRGYLAFFVFLHHSAVYYFLLTANRWDTPPSKLFTHFGQTSVALFFMITAFLFFNKLIEARTNPINWTHFFISRVMRLYPLYFIALSALFIAVFIVSNYTIKESLPTILDEIKQWILFAMFDSPNINQYNETNSILAGVIWSIKYEWLFYLSLPLIGLIFFKQNLSPFAILISSFLAYIIYYFTPINPIHFFSFLIGILTAFVAKKDIIKKISTHYISSLLIILCLGSAAFLYSSAYGMMPLILIGIAFMFIASGNNLFGLLSLKISRHLGQLSYSIYLLHPVFLFYLYRILIPFEMASKFSENQFWLINSVLAILIISLCFITYYFIEYPCINSSGKISNKIITVLKKVKKQSFNKLKPQKN